MSFKSSLAIAIIFLSFFLSSSVAALESPEVFVQTSHTHQVNSVSISPNGKYALSGSRDKTLMFWDIASGRKIRTFTGKSANMNEFFAAAFSPDGRYALSGDGGFGGNNLSLWDVSTGKMVKTFKGHDKDVVSVAISADGKFALSGSLSADANLKLWDLEAGRELKSLKGHAGWVRSAFMSLDGKYALSGGDDKIVRLWDISTGKVTRTFLGHSDVICAVALTPDNRHAVSASWDNTLRVWDVATGKEVIAFNESVKALTISPDSSTIITGGADLKLWDIRKKKALRTFKKKIDEPILSLAITPDGKYVMTGGFGIKLWEMATGREIKSFGGEVSEIASVAVSPDRETLVSGQTSVLNFWDAATGKKQQTVKSTLGIKTALISNNGAYVIAGGWDYATRSTSVKVWDLSARREIKTIGKEGGAWVQSVGITPDDRQVLWASRTDRSTIRLSDIATGMEIKTFTGHESDIKQLSVSRDGKYVISSDNFDLTLWDISAGQRLANFEGKQYQGFISPDGKHVVLLHTDPDKEKIIIKFWHIPSKKVTKDLSVAYKGKIRNGDVTYYVGSNFVVMSPNNRKALFVLNDMTMILLDITTGKVTNTFAGHTNDISSATFSPDSKQIYSSSHDGTIRLWDVPTGMELAQFISFADGEWVVITPQGYYNASSKGEKHINLRFGNRVFGVENYREKFFKPDLVKVALAGGSLKALEK